MTDTFNMREEKPEDVRSLLKTAKERREQRRKWHLLGEICLGKTVDITKNAELFEALNKERMDFEDIMKLHPENVNEALEYVKQRKLEQCGKWYNSHSQAWWGEKGAIPTCVYHARPSSYWRDNDFAMFNHFLNLYPKFRIAEYRI